MDNLRYDCSKPPCDDDTAAAERIRYNTSSPLDIAAQSLPQCPQLLVNHIEPDKVVEIHAEVVGALRGIILHLVERGDVFFL